MSPRGFKPRQFEYHPTENFLLMGSVEGEVVLTQTSNKDSKSPNTCYKLGQMGKPSDSILGKRHTILHVPPRRYTFTLYFVSTGPINL